MISTTGTATSAPALLPAYPIAHPQSGDDPRFCLGLLIDVAEALTNHPYPPVCTGPDCTHWLMALFAAIYPSTESTT